MTSIPEIMSGVQLTGHGGPDKLVWNDAIPVPRPGPGQVLVRVLAAGVNNTDINTRIGWYSSDVTSATEDAKGDDVEEGGWSGALEFPRIQGGDLCGRVVETGEAVSSLSIGQRVICPTNQPCPEPDAPTRFRSIGSEFDGAFAEYCMVYAHQLFDVSDAPLTDVELGAMPCAWGTAWNLLERASAKTGERILITGASGGVGLAAVSLAALRGAEVTAECSSRKADAVRDAGAIRTIDRGEYLEPDSFDLWVDVVGGPNWQSRLETLRPGGRLATSGAIAGPVVEADLRTIYLKDLTIFGCSYSSAETFEGLVRIINKGDVRPLVSRTYPLRDIAMAQADFEAKKFPGKLVLIP